MKAQPTIDGRGEKRFIVLLARALAQGRKQMGIDDKDKGVKKI